MKQFKTYLGSAAAMYIGLGVVPKTVRIYNMATGLAPVVWNEGMLANSVVAGGIIDVAGTYTPRTAIAGLRRYNGGDIISTLSANYVVDPGILSANKTNLQGAAANFTMDTAANGTGHFDGLLAAGAGAGSLIELSYLDKNGRFASWIGRIAALGTATSANGVTLTPEAPSSAQAGLTGTTHARIVYVGPAYDLITAPVGTVMPAGLYLADTTYMTPAVQLLLDFDYE